MSTIEEHCKASLERFGRDYKPLHELIDCYAGKRGRDSEGVFDYTDNVEKNILRKYRHKEKLHNKWFIDIIREMYGNDAAAVLEQHVLEDYRNHEIFCNEVPDKRDRRIFWRSLYK